MTLVPPDPYEMVKAELIVYVDDLLREFTAKTLGITKPPLWLWTSIQEIPAFYDTSMKVIFLWDTFWVTCYLHDPYKTKRLLRISAAHEFWHWVQQTRGEWVIRLPTLSFPLVGEHLASKQAARLSGISDVEAKALMEELARLFARVMKEEVKESEGLFMKLRGLRNLC